MIKYFKEIDIIRTNISRPYWFTDENGNEINQLPTDVEELRLKTIDTLNWLIGQSIKEDIEGRDFTKLSAANSKAVALNTKIITYLLGLQNKTYQDLGFLTDTEKEILQKEQILAQNGYADSQLLLKAVNSIIANSQKYQQLIEQAVQATTKEELVEILESV